MTLFICKTLMQIDGIQNEAPFAFPSHSVHACKRDHESPDVYQTAFSECLARIDQRSRTRSHRNGKNENGQPRSRGSHASARTICRLHVARRGAYASAVALGQASDSAAASQMASASHIIELSAVHLLEPCWFAAAHDEGSGYYVLRNQAWSWLLHRCAATSNTSLVPSR